MGTECIATVHRVGGGGQGQLAWVERLLADNQGGGKKKKFDSGWDIFFGGDPP